MAKYILVADNPANDPIGTFRSKRAAIHEAYNGGYVNGAEFILLRDIDGARHVVTKIKVVYKD